MKLPAAILLISLVSTALAGYRPRSPRYYNWLEQQGEYVHVPVIGDEHYPQQIPEMGNDFRPYPYLVKQQQDYDPLDHYPYVNNPYDEENQIVTRREYKKVAPSLGMN